MRNKKCVFFNKGYTMYTLSFYLLLSSKLNLLSKYYFSNCYVLFISSNYHLTTIGMFPVENFNVTTACDKSINTDNMWWQWKIVTEYEYSDIHVKSWKYFVKEIYIKYNKWHLKITKCSVQIGWLNIHTIIYNEIWRLNI